MCSASVDGVGCEGVTNKSISNANMALSISDATGECFLCLNESVLVANTVLQW